MPRLLGKQRKYARKQHNPYQSLAAVPLGKTGGAKVEKPAIHYFWFSAAQTRRACMMHWLYILLLISQTSFSKPTIHHPHQSHSNSPWGEAKEKCPVSQGHTPNGLWAKDGWELGLIHCLSEGLAALADITFPLLGCLFWRTKEALSKLSSPACLGEKLMMGDGAHLQLIHHSTHHSTSMETSSEKRASSRGWVHISAPFLAWPQPRHEPW